MNTRDIKLPPLPEWADTTLQGEDRDSLFAWAESAIEADRKHFAELFMDLSRYAAGMYEQDHDPQMEGVSDGYWYAAEFLLGNKDAVKELEADRKRRGEPVAESERVYLRDKGYPEYLDGAQCQYVIERGKPYPLGDPVAFVYEKEDAEKIVAALNAQPAEPVKVPSDDLQGLSDRAYCQYIEQMRRPECLGWEQKVKDRRFGEAELKAHTKAGEFLGRHRAFSEAAALLARYRKGTP